MRLLGMGGAVGLSGCVDVAKVAEIAGAAVGRSRVLSERTVASGLRAALQIGTQRASGTLSQTGGFSNNPVLRIVVPDALNKVAKLMRNIGFSGYVDELELAMNRSAERAVGEAVPVFWNMISAMSISDAFSILRGPQDAATRYFEERTSTTLRGKFEPIVRNAMREVGLYQKYAELTDRYNHIPLTKPVAPSLEGYIADEALQGLSVLATEEGRIRKDPIARTTELLRTVFA
jgi:hypothetical protein